MSDELRIERRDDGWILWTLQRPERKNALSRALVDEMHHALNDLKDDSSARVLVLHGAGGSFCAGADLKERAAMSSREVVDFLDRLGACLDALDRLPLPTIAALEGHVLGGGLELALACDFRIAAPGTRLGLPEVSLGILPGAGGTQRLSRIIGESWAKEWILLAKVVDVVEASERGLLHRVAPSAEGLLAEVERFAQPLLQGAALAQREALQAIDAAAGPLEQGLRQEREAYLRLLGSADRLEALAAFAEKRAPRFRGR